MPSDGLHGSSVLEIEIYKHRTIGNNEYIGGAKERIEVLLAAGATSDDPFHSSTECTRTNY
jgi:hypothetical protein